MIRTVAKFVAWLVGGLTMLTVMVYLVTVAVNWNDVPPSAAVKHFTELRAKRPPVADEHNAFVYLVGMSVDAGYDPLRAGMAMVEHERKRPPQTDSESYSHPDYPQEEALGITAKPVLDLLDACRELDTRCLQFLANDEVASIEYGPSEQLLLARYRSLLGFSEWRENDVTPDGPLPSYSPALTGQKLALFAYWKDSARYGAEEITAQLEADARFWRGVLGSADSLITSMVAVRALQNNLFWSNLIMRRDAGKHATIELPATWQRPIGDEERLMERVWSGEWSLAEKVLTKIQADGLSKQSNGESERSFESRLEDWLLMPLFKPRDTLNRHAEDFVSLMASYRVPYEQLPLVKTKLKKASAGFGGEGLSFPHLFYNPIGKVLNEIAKPGYSGYMLKVADLEGARRALLAAAALRNAQTPRGRATEALAALPLRNPYTNQPLLWDEVSGSLLFEGLSEKHNRYLFPLW